MELEEKPPSTRLSRPPTHSKEDLSPQRLDFQLSDGCSFSTVILKLPFMIGAGLPLLVRTRSADLCLTYHKSSCTVWIWTSWSQGCMSAPPLLYFRPLLAPLPSCRPHRLPSFSLILRNPSDVGFFEVDPVLSLTCFAGFEAERTARDDGAEVNWE